MEQNSICNMILQNDMILYGQPKWTFGKNSCNTYEILVQYFKNKDGSLIPAWPILEMIERDDALTMLFSTTMLWETVRKTKEMSERVHANLTLSLNLLPKFAESDNFVHQVQSCLEETGLESKRLQFEISELQELSEEGAKNLNIVHDELGVGLLMGNFGTHQTNVPLLYQVHLDGLELNRGLTMHIPENERACQIAIAIQHMAHTMGMYLCAKGIDSQDQFEFFEEIGAFRNIPTPRPFS